MIQTLEWTETGVVFIDQTKLPTEEVYVTCTTHQQVADVIRNMVVRGAPAIVERRGSPGWGQIRAPVGSEVGPQQAARPVPNEAAKTKQVSGGRRGIQKVTI